MAFLRYINRPFGSSALRAESLSESRNCSVNSLLNASKWEYSPNCSVGSKWGGGGGFCWVLRALFSDVNKWVKLIH